MKRLKVLRYCLKAIWLFGPSLVTILLSYLIFFSKMGQDVILIASQSKIGTAATLLYTSLWSILLWYSSRLLAYQTRYENRDWPLSILNHAPRIIGFNAFISIQAAVVALPTFLNYCWWKVILAIFILNTVYVLLQVFPKRIRSQRIKRLMIIFFSELFGLVVLSVFIIDLSPDFTLIVDLTIIQISIFIIVSIRRLRFESHEEDDTPCNKFVKYDFLRIACLKIVRIPNYFLVNERPVFVTFNVIA